MADASFQTDAEARPIVAKAVVDLQHILEVDQSDPETWVAKINSAMEGVQKAVNLNTNLPKVYKVLLEAILKTAIDFIANVLHSAENRYKTDEEMGLDTMQIDVE